MKYNVINYPPDYLVVHRPSNYEFNVVARTYSKIRAEQIVNLLNMYENESFAESLKAESIHIQNKQENNKENILEDRISTLEKISGLRVSCRQDCGVNVFEFFSGDSTVKTCFTYKKAKLFAEGIQFGTAWV